MKKLLTKLINAGVTDEMSFISAKRIKTFNLTAFLGCIIAFAYLLFNYERGRIVLACIDLLYILTLCFLIYSHHNKRYNSGFLVATIFLAIGFSASSLLYKDGLEFFLLLIITMNLVFKSGGKNAFWAIAIYSILFIAIIIFNLNHTLYESLGDRTRVENIIIWVFLQALFLRYFGILSVAYQKEIEEKNLQLTTQKELLVENSKALEKSNHQLQEMNEAKEKIFSIIAHDVNAPISAIKGSLDLFNSDVLTKEDFVTLSKEMSIRIEQLKNNLDVLLEWSKSQMQGIEVKHEIFEIKPVIISTINLLLTNIEFKKIKVELDVEDNLFVFADPNHISLILRNLINNAIKFSYTEGKIVINSQRSENSVSINVQDFGVGIDENTLHSLFHTININSQYGTNNERGTGLGLMLCREFVEKNNGKISVKSAKNKGSIFTFKLPSLQ